MGGFRARVPGRGVRAVLLAAALAGPGPAAAQLRGTVGEGVPPAPFAEPTYRVRPVDGAPTRPGVRRTIETFADWTLICDSERRRRVCNASQSIVGADGGLAFSWSLAATQAGEPVFLVRAPVGDFPARTVTLAFGAHETTIRLGSCDLRLCLGFLPLDPAILKRIKERGAVAVRYRIAEGALPTALTVSLDGLGAATAAIPAL